MNTIDVVMIAFGLTVPLAVAAAVILGILPPRGLRRSALPASMPRPAERPFRPGLRSLRRLSGAARLASFARNSPLDLRNS